MFFLSFVFFFCFFFNGVIHQISSRILSGPLFKKFAHASSKWNLFKFLFVLRLLVHYADPYTLPASKRDILPLSPPDQIKIFFYITFPQLNGIFFCPPSRPNEIFFYISFPYPSGIFSHSPPRPNEILFYVYFPQLNGIFFYNLPQRPNEIFFYISFLHPSGIYLPLSPSTKWNIILCILPAAKWDILLHFLPTK